MSAAAAVSDIYKRNVYYSFNRKEEKDHGEGGVIVGKKLSDGDNVVIIEDVITAGTAIRQTLPIINNAAKNVSVNAVIISVDRQERGKNEKSAVQEVYDEFGIKVYSIVTLTDIIECINEGLIDAKQYLDKIIKYRNEYGV